MPLEKAAPGTPGFSRNVETEVKAGKPVAQAVAIAYRMSGERQDAGERFVAKRLWDNGPWACYDTKKNVEAGRFQYKNDAMKKAAQMNASRSDADPAYERNVAETKKTFPNVKHFTSEGHPDWKKHGVKDAANASPIYEENGEFFFPKPGSRERFGPYASKAEATNAAANAGVVSDADPCFKNFEMVGMKEKGGKPVPNCVPEADEAILGRKDAEFKEGDHPRGSDGKFGSGGGSSKSKSSSGTKLKEPYKDLEVGDPEAASEGDWLKLGNKWVKLKDDSDESLDAAIKKAGLWKKGGEYPDFMIYGNGELMGGGGGPNSGAMMDAAPSIRQEGDEWVITSDTNGSKSVIRLDVKDYSRSEALEYATSLPQYTYGKFSVQADALPALDRALAAADALYAVADSVAKDAERDLPGESSMDADHVMVIKTQWSDKGTKCWWTSPDLPGLKYGPFKSVEEAKRDAKNRAKESGISTRFDAEDNYTFKILNDEAGVYGYQILNNGKASYTSRGGHKSAASAEAGAKQEIALMKKYSRSDAERDLPGSSTTEGNYGIDASEEQTLKEIEKEGFSDGIRGEKAYNVYKGKESEAYKKGYARGMIQRQRK